MNDERADLMKRVGRAMALPPAQSGLSVTRSDGTRPVVGALASDLVVDVLRRVHESGGAANVVVAEGPRIVVLAMREDGEQPSAQDAVVHRNVTMAMLLAPVRQEGHVRTFVLEPDAVVTVDDPHTLLAPA